MPRLGYRRPPGEKREARIQRIIRETRFSGSVSSANALWLILQLRELEAERDALMAAIGPTSKPTSKPASKPTSKPASKRRGRTSPPSE